MNTSFPLNSMPATPVPGNAGFHYGPTRASGQAQVEIINNLADRHIPAIAVAPSDPNAVVPEMKRARKLGSKVITFYSSQEACDTHKSKRSCTFSR